MNRAEKSFKWFTWLLTVACLAVFLPACDIKQKPEDAIVSKWEEIGGTETLEFFKGGTLVLADKSKGRDFKGTYEFVSGNEIKIDLENRKSFNIIFAKFMIMNGELIFEMPDGRVYKYKKTK